MADRYRRWQVPLLGVMAGTAMADPNIASTALVDASRGLGMPSSMVPMAASAMSMCLAASVISTGMLADRIGRRRLLMWALAGGALLELLVAASFTPLVFIIGRGLVGVCLGIVFSAAFATVRVVAPAERLGTALGVFGAAAGVTVLVESFVGGSLATVLWRASFLVVPVCFAACLLLVPRMLPVEPPIGSGPVDGVGQVLLVVGIVGPLFAISRLSTSFTSPVPLGALAIGLASLVGFYLWERHTAHPFFPVRILTLPTFLAGLLFGIGFNLSNSVFVLQLANVWQYVWRMDTVQVSAAQVPALAIGVVASIVAGRKLSTGWHERGIGSIGFALAFLGFASLTLVRVGSSFWVFVPAMLLVGAGAQVLNVPFGSLVMKSAPHEYVGPVTASRTTLGQFTYALGMAGATVLVDRLTVGGIVDRLQAAGAPPAETGQALDVVTMYVKSGADPSTAAAQQILAEAATSYAHAFAITMGLVAALMVLMAAVAYWLLRGGRGVAVG